MQSWLRSASPTSKPGSVGLLSVFMCQNDPGLYEEWDPTAGGNRAFTFGADAALIPVPSDGVAMLGETSAWMRGHNGAGRRAGAYRRCSVRSAASPHGCRNDGTPTCGHCAKPMTFVVQLEEGHDHVTAANFGGGGCGYGYRCGPCGDRSVPPAAMNRRE